MKFAKLLIYGGIVALLAQSSCKSPTEPTGGGAATSTSKIKGIVQRSDNSLPIFGAVVRDLNGLAPPDTSKSPTGAFTLTYQLTGQITARITASAPGYTKDNASDTISVTLAPGDTTATGTIILGVDSTSPPPGVTTTGKAANIVLIGSGSANIAIRGTGSNESTPMSFEVRDSLGIPISAANSVLVTFYILGGPGGGEYVFPASALTDDKGRVSTRVTSGTRPGVLQLYASARNDSVKSSPVRVTISSGLPDPSHFSVTTSKLNLPGGAGFPVGFPGADNQKATISVIVGDRFGNPVQAGTAISFTTSGGIIQATSTTSSSGIATAELSTANPRPAGGIAIVTARTVGDSGTNVSGTVPIVFSGPTNILVQSTAFAIPDSSSFTLPFQVQDQFGNPLSAGTNIKASVSGPGAASLQLSLDVDVTLPDTRDTNFTNFNVRLTDKTRGGASGPVILRIEVKSPNNSTGDVEFKEVQGIVLSSGGGGGGGGIVIGTPTADRIGVVSVSKSSIIVNDGSASDKSLTTVTFDVRDSVGNLLINPLNPSAAKVYVTFQVIPSDGILGGANLLITADSTNEFAQVSTKLLAGTKSGVFTIKATTVVTGKPPISASTNITIRSGPPDPAHFAIAPNRYNFPALERVDESLTDAIVVSLADQYSNPIEAGTQVYFDATNLAVDPVAVTNSNGFASVKLYAAGKKPMGSNIYPGLSAGEMRLRGRTVNLETGAEIRDSILLIVTGRPIITKTGGPATYAISNAGSAGPWTFTVVDQLGHPMSAGTNISVSAPGGTTQGNGNVTMPDVIGTGSGVTSFSVTLVDADATTSNTPPLSGDLLVTVNHPVYGSFTLILASGTIQ